MTYKRKTFREKLEGANKLEIVDEVKPRGSLKGKMVIPPCPEYEDIMKKVPRGKLVTQDMIRDYFAKKYKADFCCPLVTGIFVNIVAHVAQEDMLLLGKKIDEITPYWRTLKSNGELNPKYPGGVEAQASMLIKEGHEIEMNKKGQPKKIKEYEKELFIP